MLAGLEAQGRTRSAKAGSSVDRVEVFAYLDYRAFLADHYQHKKLNSRLSYRSFSRKAQLKSPNYLKLVIEGQRNLTQAMALRFAKACRLEAVESEYFLALVSFGQAQSLEERSLRYQDLKRFQHYRASFRLDVTQDTYHSRWYLPAIRELVTTASFREDPVWIADTLCPNISVEEAETALDTLQQLGLVQRDEAGCLRQASVSVSTGSDRVRSLHLKSYHRKMLEHAATSLERLPALQRDIAAVTLRMGPNGIQRLKERMQAFRRELMDLADAEADADQVIHVGMQLLPLTLPCEEPGEERS
jgi:uncharacterized protein (TIGR02147 family)